MKVEFDLPEKLAKKMQIISVQMNKDTDSLIKSLLADFIEDYEDSLEIARRMQDPDFKILSLEEAKKELGISA